LQATAQCAATFVRAVGRPNNDPLDRELHRCIAEQRDVARFTAALGHLAFVQLASIRLWLRLYESAP
jgi:hypothetical protein